MTHTHTANNPVYRRDMRIGQLRSLKSRMQKLNFSTDEIKEKLTNTCLFKWNLTTRSANDYVKVAMMENTTEQLDALLAYKEKLLEEPPIQS